MGQRQEGQKRESTAADIPSMVARLEGETSGCLCSPLGRSACTNKRTPGLWSNGNQTCPRTKSLFSLSPSLLLTPSLCMTSAAPTRTPAEGRTSIIPNRPENIPCFFPMFSHKATAHDILCFYISTDLLDLQALPDYSDRHLSSQAHFI